ncbi:MAG: hypothetical protein KJ583_05685 [Nanoarchaeota archaeon]|nr:hypothetical protein [Nanoarchaeota archaeon]MBU1270215.1 hypothetical protein [Nanoarchaeota archaeon]MBU1604781.1 hypothetical protein [Nanoarchaeota archaeon]MBU2442855.1 hypothetical protein [Nanoarchaeota archaeon]
MSKPEVLEKLPINIVELKHELAAIRKRDGDLTFRGNKTEEYLNDFAKLSHKDALELIKKLQGLNITRLKDNFIHKIVDLLPSSIAELKVILQGYTLTVSNADMQKIMVVVKEYTK